MDPDGSPVSVPGEKTKRLRQLWLQIHLWIGLTAGLLVALVGLSGSALVFIEDIVEWENGDILFPENAPAEIDIRPEQVDLWIERALEEYPQLEEVETVEFPNAGHVPATVPTLVSHIKTEDGSERHFLVSVHPGTDEFIGAMELEKNLWIFLIFFHFTLLVPFGFQGVAWSSLLAFVSLLTGLILWWPRATLRHWKNAFRFPTARKGRAFWLQWHNALGVYLLLPMIVVLYTGIYLVKPHWFEPAIEKVSDIRDIKFQMPAEDEEHDHEHGDGPGHSHEAGEEKSPGISPGEAAAIAMEAHPGLKIRHVMPTSHHLAHHKISLMPEGWDPRKGHTELWIDPESGEIVTGWTGEEAHLSEKVKSATVVLHTDLDLGWFGKSLVFLAGLALPVLYVSGIVLWRKRARRKKLARRAEVQGGEAIKNKAAARKPVALR